MNCSGSFPGYFFTRDLIPGAVNFPWTQLNSDISYRTGTSYNVPLQQPLIDQYNGYDKEVIRQTMLSHEATFKYQVQELHRLYTRQKELMIEFQRRRLQFQASQSNPINFDVSRTIFNVPGPQTGSNLSSLGAEKTEEPVLMVPYPKEPVKFGNKILDLELPGDHYIDSEEDENIVDENAPKESLKLLIDLNEPFHLDESEIPDSDTCCKDIINLNQDLSQESNKEPQDLNGLDEATLITPEKTSSSHNLDVEVEPKMKLKKIPIIVHALPCLDFRSKPLKTKDNHVKSCEINALEAPVSPENKECSPPRGESDDIQLEIAIIEVDKVAAEAIISISSSRVKWSFERRVNTPPKPFSNCLEWFATVASSMKEKGKGRNGKKHKVVRKKAINKLGVINKAKKRKRIISENSSCYNIVDWFRKGIRRGRRARNDFQDFPFLALLK